MRMTCRIFIFIVLSGILTYCSLNNSGESLRIFYVNSYHAGYGSSDDVMEGITETLENGNVELEISFLDAKRKTTEQETLESVQAVLAEIEKFSPDLLIVSDDNAVKDLIVPYFNNTDLPVVFCGVNWSAEQYSLGENVTGMLEVLPLRELLTEVISGYPGTNKLVVLSENSLSEQNNKILLDTLYRNLGLEPEYLLADDFESWKQFFEQANETADLIYMPTNGAIKQWDDEEARKLVENNLEIPAVTCDDFMMPYVVFGLTKVAREQGEWAAETALGILNGNNPDEIPYVKNRQTKALLNNDLAEKTGFRISEQMKQRVSQIN